MERQKNKSIIILIICVLLHLSLLLLQNIISVPDDKLPSIYIMLVIGLVYYAIYLLVLFWYDRGVSLAFVFVAVTAFFILGQHIVLLFNPNQGVFLMKDYGISMSTYFDTLYFVLICIDWIVLAYCIFRSFNLKIVVGKEKNSLKAKKEYSQDDMYKVDYTLRTIGFVILVVSIPFTVQFLYENIRLTALLGYQERMGLEQSARNYVAIIAGFFPTSIYMILLSDFYNKYNRYFCLLMLSVYSVLYMLAGSRLNIIKIIVVLVVIFYFKEGKLDFRKILKLGLLGYGAIILLTALSYFRSGNGVGGGLVDYIVNNDPILKFLEETGVTFTTIANVVNNCPEPIEPVYGKTYVNQFFVIIPNLFFDKNPFQVLLSETFNPLYHYGGLSSSMFAEAYYNMLGSGFIYMIVIGWVLSKVSKTINNPKSIVTFLIATYVYSELVWAIRFDTYLILRSVLYYIVIPYYVGKQFLKKH